jgi:hypothetical protein
MYILNKSPRNKTRWKMCGKDEIFLDFFNDIGASVFDI